MNDAYAVNPKNLLRVLPDVLKFDPSMMALAASVAEILAEQPENIEKAKIYTVADRIPENLLDILAFDFKVDWWDPNYTLEEKRKTFVNSWAVQRTLGTKYAIETAVNAIFPGTQVREWFEYGGDPFYFRIMSTNLSIAQENLERFIFILNIVKRNSAWLEEIQVSMPWDMSIYAGFGYHESTFETHRMGGG